MGNWPSQNMKKQTLLLILLTLLTYTPLLAQLRVKESTIDLGEIGWHKPKTYELELQNKSRRPVVINDVRTDCGCTSATWHKGRLLEPGEKTHVTITYDAMMLGHFKKAVRIYTQEHSGLQQTEVWLQGVVLPEVIDYEREFPVNLGKGIHLSANTVEFDDVRDGARPVQTLRIANGTKANYTPTLMHLPAWLHMKAEPEVLRPGKTGTIYLTADAGQIRQYGLTQISVYVSRFMGDKVGRNNEIQVSLTQIPRVRTDAASLANAPRAEVDTVVWLSTKGAKKARRMTGTLPIRNTGARPLQINRIQVYNLGLQVSINRSTIQPGQAATIKVNGWADTAGTQYKGRRRILLITNDPARPTITIEAKEH